MLLLPKAEAWYKRTMVHLGGWLQGLERLLLQMVCVWLATLAGCKKSKAPTCVGTEGWGRALPIQLMKFVRGRRRRRQKGAQPPLAALSWRAGGRSAGPGPCCGERGPSGEPPSRAASRPPGGRGREGGGGGGGGRSAPSPWPRSSSLLPTHLPAPQCCRVTWFPGVGPALLPLFFSFFFLSPFLFLPPPLPFLLLPLPPTA